MRDWKQIGLLGYGAIGSSLARVLRAERAARSLAAVLLRPGRARPADLPEETQVFFAIGDMLGMKLDLVVECASQNAVAELAVPVVESGADLMLISTGALVDDDLRGRIATAAQASGSRIHLPPGAVAGIDGLGALRLGGLDSVRYTSVKPPHAWRGTPAEQTADLGSLSEPTTVFEGSARDAARLFPKNANLAATVALAGIGLDATRVRLVADPHARENCSCIDASGPAGTLSVRFQGPAEVSNPRTSASTALSLARALINAERPFVI